MLSPMRSLLLSILALSPLLFIHGKIEQNVILNDDRDVIQLSENFGFERSEDDETEDSQQLCQNAEIAGYLNLTLSRINVLAPVPPKAKRTNPANFSRLGFVLVSADDGMSLEQFPPGFVCRYWNSNPSKLGQTLITFKEIQNMTFRTDMTDKQKTAWEDTKRTYQAKVCNGRVRALYFLNCEDHIAVSFRARVDTFNVLNDAGRKSYVSVGQRELDEMYWVMFALFAGATAAWGWFLWSSKDTVHTIHYLMLLLAIFRTLTLMCQAFESYFLEAYGTPDGWNIAYYIFTFFRGVMFFTVVVLIGTGWSYMKPFLGDKEKRILMVVVPLQIFANIAIIVTEEESPSVRDWLTWRDAFHLVDIICCCAVLFPIVWSIKHLREAAKTDGKAARNLEKLTLFRQFYVMVVVYIYFTRIVVYLLKSTLTDYEWMSDAAEEIATLVFYIWTGLKFRPHKENPYLKLHQEEVELS